MTEVDLEELAAGLQEFAPPEKKAPRSAREERIIAGFEEIQRFYEEHGRAPRHGEERDIFERIYAVRLDRIREVAELRELVEPLDHQGLLQDLAAEQYPSSQVGDDLDLDALADELRQDFAHADITELRHVRSFEERRAAEEVADRRPCDDFDSFKPLFEKVAAELKHGLRQSQPIKAGNRAVEVGDFFILDGVIIYIAEVGNPVKTTAGEVDKRLRVIFANGTESNHLLRSLQRAFYDDPSARRLVSPEGGQLTFSGAFEPDDVESGTIYVLRSLSEHPYIAQNRDVIHKIGVTGGKVETRIAGAERDATYLLAGVEIVSTYKLSGINRSRLEKVFHKLFSPARLDITIEDRFGNPVQPKEWFLVPAFVIDEAVERIKDGSITEYIYDPKSASLVKA